MSELDLGGFFDLTFPRVRRNYQICKLPANFRICSMSRVGLDVFNLFRLDRSKP